MVDDITLSDLAVAIDAEVSNAYSGFEDTLVSGISIDTRALDAGEVYLALVGENHDGHDFIENAISKGCSALILSHDKGIARSVPTLCVRNTLSALGNAAKLNRERFGGKVVALTGSSGKTTTKGMLFSLLSPLKTTRATQGNFNNEIGVPLTLLSIDQNDELAVVEMGARAKGDISYLTSLAKPDVAMVLNAGCAHIDVFGSYENIVAAKGEIYQSLDESGVAVLNLDDPACEQWLKNIQSLSYTVQTITFSISNDRADLYASNLVSDCESSAFELHYQGEQIPVKLTIPGRHNIQNALAAVSAAIALGFSLADVAPSLVNLEAVAGRLSMRHVGALRVIDDTYNANPASVKAGIDVLAMHAGVRVLVLAEMGELGESALSMHLDVAHYAVEKGIDELIFTGAFAEAMVAENKQNAKYCESKAEIVNYLGALTEEVSGDLPITVLVKGSRFTQMDEIVAMIEERAA